jgi:hypothetical protein
VEWGCSSRQKKVARVMKFIFQYLIWHGIGDGSFVYELMEVLVGLPSVANCLALMNLCVGNLCWKIADLNT